jgi:hypothetical protein
MGLATAVTLASLGISAYQGIKGAQAEAAANDAAEVAANEAKKIAELDKFQSLQVPTLGLGLAQQNIQARQSQELQGLRDIGAAGVLGGLTGLEQQSRAQDLALSAEGQQMQYQRDMALAQNAQQIEQGRMQREFAMNQARLAGAQAAAAEGRQNKAAAVQGGLTALSNAATLDAYKKVNANKVTTEEPPKTKSYNITTPPTSITAPPSTTLITQPNFGATITPIAGQNVSGWQIGQFSNPGLRDIQTGDALNDMYYRNLLGK